ncbi:MAG: hypothetical protein ACXVB9_11195 [Bdellovibrionota bacterium]
MEELPVRVVVWAKVKRTLAWALLLLAVLGGALAYIFWGFAGAAADVGVLLCLALGFWVTEGLVGVFTQTKKANPTGVMLLFFGKLAWWGTIFVAARKMPAGLDRPVALGIGSFLLALLVAMVQHYGMPRISDGNPPSGS